MKYSVIIPAFNAQNSLLRCLNSVAAARKHHAVELLVVDDGSSDRTGAIAAEFAQDHPWATVLARANGGEAAARNEGLRATSGRYVCFVDSDDTINENYFDFIDDALASTGADVIVFGLNRIDLNGRVTERPNTRIDLDSADVEKIQLQATRHRHIYWYACTRVVSRDVINGLRFSEDVKLGLDVIFNTACINNATRVSVFPDCIYNYYENPESITSTKFKPALLESIEAHYRARIKAHVWPEGEGGGRQLLLADFARSYLEHMLPYLLNNLLYLPRSERRAELMRIRDSFVYRECIPNYADRHPALAIRLIIRSFMNRNLQLTLLVLQASRGIQSIRRRAKHMLGPFTGKPETAS